VEILPGVGVEAVRIDELRVDVESRLGAAGSTTDSRAYYDPPGVLVHYDATTRVELVEVPYRKDGGSQPTLEGVPLTYRFLEDVVHDLAMRGYVGQRSDIGYDFEAGFAIFSMSSLSATDLDASASPEDERAIAEGVSIAPFSYFSAAR
jgi:hypothetical protein